MRWDSFGWTLSTDEPPRRRQVGAFSIPEDKLPAAMVAKEAVARARGERTLTLSAAEIDALLEGLNARDERDVDAFGKAAEESVLRSHHHSRLEFSRALGLKLQGKEPSNG